MSSDSVSAVFSALDARTGEVLGTYREATSMEIAAAVGQAATAAVELARRSGAERAILLERIADELMAVGDALLEVAHRETALPLPRLTGERARTVGQLRMFAQLVREGSWVEARIDRAQPDRQPAPRPELRRMLRPLGPVAVFGASNFPFAYSVAGGDTASALAAGNPVIVKGHPAHPGTSELTAQAVLRAVAACGFPAGTFALLHGATPETGLALVRAPQLAAVGFTGSERAGRALFNAAAARPVPIPVFAEMGSINPVFVLPGALQERGAQLADGLVGSFTLGVGQFCTKPGVVFGVQSPAWDSFCALVATKAAAVPAGTMLHRGISAAFTRSLEAVGDVTWLVRGPAHVARVDSAAWRQRPELAQECFGPYTLLVTVGSLAELTPLADALAGQLTVALHGTAADLAAATGLLAAASRRAGRVVCNGFPTGVEVVPAMVHGGPYPASTDARFSAVGTAAIARFARPVAWQNFPVELLPRELADENPLGIVRLVDGQPTREPMTKG
jgi:NADP-dependent aldehyde dehydrogenase